MHPDHISNHLPDLEALAPGRSSGAPTRQEPVVVKMAEIAGDGRYVAWLEWPDSSILGQRSETLVHPHEDIRSTHTVFERVADFAADIAFERPVLIERVR